jgi:hypothetical protein
MAKPKKRTLARLLDQTRELLGTDFEALEDGQTHACEFHYEDGHSQRAFLTSIEGNDRFQSYSPENSALVHVYSRVGPFTSVVDPHALLRRASETVFARVILDRDQTPPEILVEACHPIQTLTPATLAAMLQEVADYAETFEDEIFGVDQE